MDFLRRVRWPDGFRCPACGRSLAWMTARGQLRCVGCQRQTSPTAGTIFEGTRKPLRLWFQAMWYVTNQKHGVSALGVQRILGLGSYQTAWTWLHKLRRAMVRPGRDLLSGEVEVDETYLGGREVGVTGRKTNKKSIVAIAAEIRGCGTGRIRMARVKDASGESLVPFVQTAVCPGTCQGRIGREPRSVCPNGGVPWNDDSNRWLASLQWSRGGGLRTPAEEQFRQRRPSPHRHAPGSSGGRSP